MRHSQTSGLSIQSIVLEVESAVGVPEKLVFIKHCLCYSLVSAPSVICWMMMHKDCVMIQTVISGALL